jgi:ribosomal RNA-processing protein 1
MVLTYREPMPSGLVITDKKPRDAAILRLRQFLAATAEKPMDKLGMTTLWKGIFQCSSLQLVPFVFVSDDKPRNVMSGFWMSDKPLVQQELSANLAGILLDIPSADASFVFLRGFWEAIVREWITSGQFRLFRSPMVQTRRIGRETEIRAPVYINTSHWGMY